SFGFAFIGLLVLGNVHRDLAGKNRQPALNPMTRSLAYAAVYGGALVLIGVGSAFYHASLTFVGQFCDVMGMYLLASFMLLYSLSRQSLISQRQFVLFYLLLNLVLGYFLIEAPELRRYLFGGLIVATLVIENRIRPQKPRRENEKFLRAAVVVLLSGFFIWVLDITKVLCAPNSWLQGHAIWHLLGALASGFLYLYYRAD
ncbi:MAG: ceramidase, partial [candidate division KSB1 bacterium]|nr:ceramidase [candidate division KSB1 bacterium]